MSRRNLVRTRLMAGASFALLAAVTAGAALAADGAAPQPAAPTTGAGAEGTDIENVIVTAERGLAAKAAPVKASLEQTQPESIISHNFIENLTPENGNISTVVFIAPSISGISSNAGGIGNYFSTTMRGFTDGFYNVTYDGIAFGDTNNPTHHPNDYFPPSTIGAAVVDRGPGAAGDLGQANYGGAIHYFSPTVTDQFGFTQKATWGSFDSEDYATTINTGTLPELAGGKLLAIFDERRSDTELSNSGGNAFNQMFKYVLPVGDRFTLTAMFSHAWSRYNFPDSNGPGETLRQVQLYGKNFQLTDIPTDEHFVGFNYERKQTYFSYVDLKYEINPNLFVENGPYEYAYSNKTVSSNDNGGLIGGVNTSPTKPVNGNDIGGYLKRNDYNVGGDILRFTDQLPFGVLKVGALVEGSATYRQKAFYDLTTGAPDVEYLPGAKNPTLTAPSNCKTCEHSSWLQEQGFVDFNWTPLANLTISPGFKYVNFRRSINATQDTLSINGANAIGPIHGSNTYSSPLYFVTANYKIIPTWSVYAQYATSFLIPQLSDLQVPGVELQHLQPETTENYQAGTVYSGNSITADADVYMIDAANTNVPCLVPDPNGGVDAATCNAGKVRFSGVEGEAAYTLPFGLTLFANGSINDAKQLAQAGDLAAGIAGNPAQQLPNTPKWTDAVGAIYRHGALQASVSYKQVGDEAVSGAGTPSGQLKVPSYDTVNASLSYDITSQYQIKLQGLNLADKRSLTNYVPEGNETALYQAKATTSFYTFQSGRELYVTLTAKF